MRWSANIDSPDSCRVRRLTIQDESGALSCRDVCDLWQREPDFGKFFSKVLAGMAFDAFFWEVRPITTATVGAPFECAIVDSPVLAHATANPGPFLEQLDAARFADGIATFPNLGGDALLVAPCAGLEPPACAHLAAFVRHAPEKLCSAFWARVGAALASRLGPAPVWLSTSGLGVYWLHARLDRTPKYYTYAPYRRMEAM